MSPRYEIEFSVMPKDGILDPAGRAVEQAINSPHGFNIPEVKDVRVGKVLKAIVDAPNRQEALAVLDIIAQDFANPLIEQLVGKKVIRTSKRKKE